jgi:hypothetical protein
MLHHLQRWRSRGALLLIAGVVLGSGLIFVWPVLERQFTAQVTIADLVDAPERYADRMVVVRGYLGEAGMTPDWICEQLIRIIVSDISADGRWHGPRIPLKGAKPVDRAQGPYLYVEVRGYLRWYQLQRNPHAIMRPEPTCDHRWVVEVVDIRPVAPLLPATTP